MTKKIKFFAPDIFPEFKCKMGDCRHACCEGWPVGITMSNYFGLLGTACSAELRRKLDVALVRADEPSEDEYAVIAPRYDGNCPLRAEDGSCALQNELGEAMLPDVCRLYPRGIRSCDGSCECSCACSCERTIEQLFENEDALRFVESEKEIVPSGSTERKLCFETFGRTREIRLKFIKLMQNRNVSLASRIMLILNAAKKAEDALKKKNEKALDEFIARVDFEPFAASSGDCGEKLVKGFGIIDKLLEYIDAHSDSVSAWGSAALTALKKDGRVTENYFEAKDRFESAFPDWQIKFEKLLCEHMFFSFFPFAEIGDSLCDEVTALAAAYGLLRCICVGNSQKITSEEKLVDVCAAIFRLVEHSDFDAFSVRILKKLGADDDESIYDFIIL